MELKGSSSDEIVKKFLSSAADSASAASAPAQPNLESVEAERLSQLSSDPEILKLVQRSTKDIVLWLDGLRKAGQEIYDYYLPRIRAHARPLLLAARLCELQEAGFNLDPRTNSESEKKLLALVEKDLALASSLAALGLHCRETLEKDDNLDAIASHLAPNDFAAALFYLIMCRGQYTTETRDKLRDASLEQLGEYYLMYMKKYTTETRDELREDASPEQLREYYLNAGLSGSLSDDIGKIKLPYVRPAPASAEAASSPPSGFLQGDGGSSRRIGIGRTFSSDG